MFRKMVRFKQQLPENECIDILNPLIASTPLSCMKTRPL